jgi:hypothetical protein
MNEEKGKKPIGKSDDQVVTGAFWEQYAACGPSQDGKQQIAQKPAQKESTGEKAVAQDTFSFPQKIRQQHRRAVYDAGNAVAQSQKKCFQTHFYLPIVADVPNLLSASLI